MNNSTITQVLALRVGERVEVRSIDEILATLDDRAALDRLPFMPEMVKFCGRQFTVFKRADKVNDLVERSGLRRMKDAVLLAEVRCDGRAHGGCEALCQVLWKEAWLKRVPSGRSQNGAGVPSHGDSSGGVGGNRTLKAERFLASATRTPTADNEPRFCCQITETRKASSYLAWWDPRQYVRDFRSGNVGIAEMARYFGFWLFLLFLRHVRGYRMWLALYESLRRRGGGDPLHFRPGTLGKTPTSRLHLCPGEVVEVKGYDEILETLNEEGKNRGLLFDREMIKYCGGRFKVLSRVNKLIDPKTGTMITLNSDCIILDGVTVKGDYHRFYPQNEYPFWREIWLRRVESNPSVRES